MVNIEVILVKLPMRQMLNVFSSTQVVTGCATWYSRERKEIKGITLQGQIIAIIYRQHCFLFEKEFYCFIFALNYMQ